MNIAIYIHIIYTKMKRLLLLIVLVFLTLTLSAQKKSDYEKYWQAREDSIAKSQTTLSNNATKNQITSVKPEYDDLYYQPSKDAQKVKKHKRVNTEDTLRAIVDTLVKQNPDIQVNYYSDDPFFYSNMIGRFYYGGFNYWMYSDPWFYNNYWMYDAYDWYWDMRFSGYPYWNYPYYNGFYFGYNNYWGWNFGWNWGWNWHYPYYHNNWNHNNWYTHNGNWNNGGGNYHRPEYGHRETGSALSNHRIIPQQPKINPQNRSTYSQTRRNYQPSYNNPRISERPLYNNSHIQNNSNVNTQRRTIMSTQSRTYQQVNKNQNYNVPSRSYSPPRTMDRSSQSQGFGRTFNFNSGGSSRSSSSGSNSGGSSSGGRSSGSSGRR
jgi:uncharacterized membrane protein YgcG